MATQQQNKRKASTLLRLEAQLTSGLKPLRIQDGKSKKGKTSLTETVALTDQDKKRLNNEISNLKTKLHIQ